MKLADITFPQVKAGTEPLYFHGMSSGNLDAGVVPKGSVLSTDTYFNLFSLLKYKKYTVLENLSLTICAKGSFGLKLYAHPVESPGESVLLVEQNVSTDTHTPETIPINLQRVPENSVLSYSFETQKSDGVFYGGYYHSDVSERPAKVALVICTYRREEQVQKTIHSIKNDILENEQNEIRKELELFVIDNGRTLSGDWTSHPQIHCIPNKNLGGSGGFTRGMIEVFKRKKEFTHVLLMDDDITLEPQVLFRTIQFLKILKPEYQDVCLAGSMLYEENPCIQHEAGAVWEEKHYSPRQVKSSFDLRHIDNLLENEKEEMLDYAGWGYFCLPVSYIRQDNFPLPLFMKWDDVEYAVRNRMRCITMNGIGFWHPSYESNFHSSLDYYILRNALVFHACHGKPNRFSRLQIAKRYFVQSIYENYEVADCILLAIGDYLKGVPFFQKTDGEKNHQKVQALFQKKAEIREHSTKEKVLLTCRAFAKAGFWKYLIRYLRMQFCFIKKHKQADREYWERYRELCSIDHWNDLLKETENEKI